MHTPIDRRAFLKRSGATGLFLAPSLGGLVALAGCHRDPVRPSATGYGELIESQDVPGILLPRGFHCRLISQAGELMPDGMAVPNAFDGMAAFSLTGNRIRLVRNHELRHRVPDAPQLAPGRAYDEAATGGCTTVEVVVGDDGSVEKTGEWVSLAGTLVNCAGGPTPWGSWLSCEETIVGTADADGNPTGWQRNHGYVFEVPSGAREPADPVPLRAMGRFVHEATAVDPRTGIVYLTEDQDPSGFFRFLPAQPGTLQAGGRLQMLMVRDRPGYDTRTRQWPGGRLRATWVDIPDPDPDTDYLVPDAVFSQGLAGGGARFARLEGCWAGDGFIYFDATTGGDAGAGQIWQYVPDGGGGGDGDLVLVYESPSRDVLKNPDNLCISPRGGLAICEDSGGDNYLRGIDRDGNVFDFMCNTINDLEWAGVCFSPQGRTLFVNIQGALWLGDGTEPKGMTVAVWGPWEAGAL